MKQFNFLHMRLNAVYSPLCCQQTVVMANNLTDAASTTVKAF